MWPWIKTRSWVSETTSISVSHAARDPRLWIVLLLVIFVYVTGRDIYPRTAVPIPSADEIAQAVVSRLPNKASNEQPSAEGVVKHVSGELVAAQAQIADLKTSLASAQRGAENSKITALQLSQLQNFEEQRIEFENAIRYRINTKQIAEYTPVRIYAEHANDKTARMIADMFIAAGFSPMRDLVGNAILKPDFNIPSGITVRGSSNYPTTASAWTAIRSSMSQAQIIFKDGDPVDTDAVRIEVGNNQ